MDATARSTRNRLIFVAALFAIIAGMGVALFIKKNKEIGNVKQKVSEQIERYDSLRSIIIDVDQKYNAMKDSLLISKLIIDSLELVNEKETVRYVYIEKQRIETIDAIRNDSVYSSQAERLSEFLERKRSVVPILGGTSID